jgi:hypothetical protein
MKNTAELQADLFKAIKAKVDPKTTFVDELACVLDVSSDSAYRRIRGEKQLTLEEVYKLTNHYQLSFDSIYQLATGSIQFTGSYVDPVSLNFNNYLSNMAKQLKYMISFKGHSLFYLCKDIPIFHHYQFKALAAFKYFFWNKTLLQTPGYNSRKLYLTDYPDETFYLGRKILELYNQMNVYEIWNIETLNSTLRQVEFYHDTNVFASKEDLLKIYQALEKLFVHLETQAQLGYTFDSADPERRKISELRMYFNEVVMGDNSLLALVGSSKIAFINHTAVNYLITTDIGFCEYQYQYYQNLMKKSTLISSVSQRERSRFFNALSKRIATRKQKLGVGISHFKV